MGPTRELIREYLQPAAVHLVFIDIGWDNAANTTSSLVAGGYEQWLANWLSASQTFGIDNIFFTKQWGYFFSSPSWDQTFLAANPSAGTVGASGASVPLTNCAGCLTSSGWTVASPAVYRQFEQDLKQLYTWYGHYTSWIGFGEGATGDRNNYGSSGTSVKTSRPFDNSTISVFANSVFFQKNINMTTGEYLGTNDVSEIWNEFLASQPYISLNIGEPLVSSIQNSVYAGKTFSEEFYVPFGQTVDGFVLRAYLAGTTGASAPLIATVYPTDMQSGSPLVVQPLASMQVSGLNSSGGWTGMKFANAELVPGDDYWVSFSSSVGAGQPYTITSDNANLGNGIYGSAVIVQTLMGANVVVDPLYSTAPNWRATPSTPVDVKVTSPTTINTVEFFVSDRAYDPNNVTVTVQDGATVLATGSMSMQQWKGESSLEYIPYQLDRTITLQPGVQYTIDFSGLPVSDKYTGVSGGAVTQDFIADQVSPTWAGYLGQSQFPVFELGLMNVESQSLTPTMELTDLFGSPGYQGDFQTAMRFSPAQAGNLQTFEVNVIAAAAVPGATFTVSLRTDNMTLGSHPSTASLASGSLPFTSISSGLAPCDTPTGLCTWANVTLSGNTALTGGKAYWIVMSATGSTSLSLMRLTNPYKNLVYDSPDGFTKTWGVPPDGPSDLSYDIITSSGSIVNTVDGYVQVNLDNAAIAQSFESSTGFELVAVQD